MEDKLKKLQENVEQYCGDYGTLESRLEETLWLILDILKELKESAKAEKAIEYIKNHTYHDIPKKLQNGIYERGELIIKNDFYIEDLVDILRGVGKE